MLRFSGSPFSPSTLVSVTAGLQPTISDTQARACLLLARFLPRWDCQNPYSSACGNHASSGPLSCAVAPKIARPRSVLMKSSSPSRASRRYASALRCGNSRLERRLGRWGGRLLRPERSSTSSGTGIDARFRRKASSKRLACDGTLSITMTGVDSPSSGVVQRRSCWYVPPS